MSKYYFIDRFLEKCERSSRDWKEGQTGNRNYPVTGEDLSRVGLSDLVKEAEALQKMGLAMPDWYNGHSDLTKLTFQLEKLPEYYRLVGQKPKYLQIQEDMSLIGQYQKELETSGPESCDWIRAYYQELYRKVEKGRSLREAEPTAPDLFICLNAIAGLEEMTYIRSFSHQHLGGSKVFEKKLKRRVISIAKKYHSFVKDTMEDYEILSLLSLDSYSQQLDLKGPLKVILDGKEIDFSVFRDGSVLNSQSLKKAIPAKEQSIRKVITVENKANYVSMPYEEGTLILFSHGFFSPLEEDFLKKLEQVIPDAEYFHTGDLDYGGIQIFSYIRSNIFPKLLPYHMDVETFEQYREQAGPIASSALEKLRKLKEPCLQLLIEKLIEEEKVLEQEVFLWK